MAGLRVFVSSTCFDLAPHRAQIKIFLERLGYEPILSEHSDVLYDHRVHTHTACIREIINADLVILLIGARFGGKAVPEAKSEIVLDKVIAQIASAESAIMENLSVTQLEVYKAIEAKVPIFAFIDSKVYGEHHLWKINGGMEGSKEIIFPSIEKQETAPFIFGFIDFLNSRLSGNSIISYSSVADIEVHLSKQWSMLFQRLLREEKDRLLEQRRADTILEEIKDLKTAFFQSMSSDAAKDLARNVIKFRRLAEFLNFLTKLDDKVDLLRFNESFSGLLSSFNVTGFDEIRRRGVGIQHTILVLGNNTHIRIRMPPTRFLGFQDDWDGFLKLSSGDRDAVLQGVADAESGPSHVFLHVERPFDREEYQVSTQPNALGGVFGMNTRTVTEVSENLLSRYVRENKSQDEDD